MTNLFRNSSPGALTLQQSVEQAKKRLVERGLQMRKARELAAKGRGNDTEVAHVALGEIVLPKMLQTSGVLSAIRQAAQEANIPFNQLRIGSGSNSVNPETGMPEFGLTDTSDDEYQVSDNRPLPPGNDNRQPWPRACDAARSDCVADANINSPPGDSTYRQSCNKAWGICNDVGIIAPYPRSKMVQFPDGGEVIFPRDSFDAQYNPRYPRR